MIGMAQTLAVYHYGCHTLKNRQVLFHAPTREPSDVEAVLEWGLDTPFTSQDKPPLAVSMVVTLNRVRSLRRYRLVIAQKSKLRLTQEVTAALASHSREHRLTASGFFPCSIDREYLYGYAADFFFRPTPSWLSPGRYTRSTAAKRRICKLSCKAVYTSIASKALEMDQYTVQWAVPSKTDRNKHKNRQTNQKWLCSGRISLAFVAVCFLQWISSPRPPAPRQQDTFSSGH